MTVATPIRPPGPSATTGGGPRLLGALLVEAGAVAPEQLDETLRLQESDPVRLGELLIREGTVTPEAVARALSRQLSLPFEPGPLEPEPDALAVIPGDLARRLGILPLRISGRGLTMAVEDPLDVGAVEDIRFRTGRRVEVRVVTGPDLRRGLDRGYGGELEALVSSLEDAAQDPEEDRAALERVAGAAPVVQLVDGILAEAWEAGASDLHLEPGPAGLTVRVRIDGLLRKVRSLPASIRPVVLSRLKIMAGMDIAVRRRPQDGGLHIRTGGRTVALRVSTLPAQGGEKAVVRILEPDRAPGSLADLGMGDGDLERVRRILRSGQGVVLATGPTGSGKSSTLQAALREVDRAARNVTTLEDPVEYPVPDTTQVQVDPRAGLTFPAALRAVLRQDPDVVMVGEIRDVETAEIAMAAAVTGHLVLSTLHTTDAPSALTRLLHMGVPPYLVAAGVSGVIAQRLVRLRCTRCGGRPGTGGCEGCVDGYRGRTGVFQILVMNDRLREAVVQGASTPVLRRLAREAGMGFLADDARRQVSEGRTTPHEVARVVRGDPGGAVPCPSCGDEVPPDAQGCPWCGDRRLRSCRCGRRVDGGWRFCPGCLGRLEDVSPVPSP
ncbi:MAG TPA: ATPase, T2SS/T4P/T4SS family [Longimicrobiales bacterium]|nr:ATPase, T2SS/T4P/T4SS family [Longimicrobiales bacterium]